ncbi:class F sortase [Candidatus Daviesbacteria bacterium]|nr:class F sortase [Candidatus Daviesbacteria bacterium]
MKKSLLKLILTFFLIGGLLGVVFAQGDTMLNLSQNTPSQNIPAVTAAPTIAPKPVVSEPDVLVISKLNIRVKVEPVGEDTSGKMDVPKVVENVGWYNLGFKPGEEGSAVIAGHFDTVTGAPAVFYYLNQLTKGDEVIVTDKNGKNYTFKVEKSVSYPVDQAPLEEIFANKDKARLNLITCFGTWDVGNRNYTDRLVVYTELENS